MSCSRYHQYVQNSYLMFNTVFKLFFVKPKCYIDTKIIYHCIQSVHVCIWNNQWLVFEKMPPTSQTYKSCITHAFICHEFWRAPSCFSHAWHGFWFAWWVTLIATTEVYCLGAKQGYSWRKIYEYSEKIAQHISTLNKKYQHSLTYLSHGTFFNYICFLLLTINFTREQICWYKHKRQNAQKP